MDQNQLDAFLGHNPRSHVDSMHSSLPLLSVPQVGPLPQRELSTEYADAPALMPSPYSDDGHATVQLNNDTRGDDAAPSGFLPSPYSQHGHGDDQDEPVPDLPQPRTLTASPRPESQFYAPIAVQPVDTSIRALEDAVSGSRPTTPGSLSMMTHGTARRSLATPDVEEASH
jgi:hypothetical protein